MSKSKIYTVSFKRKREGKTDYPKRLNYLKSDKTRFVIRVSTNNLSIQAVDYHADGDKITITVKSSDLKKYGWKYRINLNESIQKTYKSYLNEIQ